MKLSPFRLLAAVVILLAAGLGIAGYLLIDEDDESGDGGDDSALATTTSTAATTSSTSDFTNLNTATTAAPTTTTAVKATTTTKAPATTTTTAAGGSTTSTTKATGVCGSGTARVTFSAKDLVTTGTESTFVAQAVVENQINRPIEVDVLVAEVSFPDGMTRTVKFTTAGVTIAPSTSSTFTAERITTPKQFASARITSFAYFTAGQRDRCRVST